MKLGTEENPFQNVHEAFDYIKKQEKVALLNTSHYPVGNKMLLIDPFTGVPVPSWLDPDTAFLSHDYPLDSFIVTKQQSGMFSFKPNLAGKKFLFRGQVEDYRDKEKNIVCVPGLFRDKSQDYFLSEMILAQEMWALIDSHPMVKLLGLNGVELCGYKFKMHTNYGGISQHYFNKTRYLDLTSDEEAAKFFACCDYHFNDDSYTPHTKDGIGVIYYYEIVMPLAFQKFPPGPIEPSFHLSTIGKQIFPRSGAQHGYLIDISKGLDFNNLPYTRKVYFRHDAIVSKTIYEKAKKGLVYMPNNILDEYWREKISSSKTDRMVSEAALLINLNNNRNETKSSIVKKLKSRGFTIYKGSPTFTPNQLSSFYEDIKNGWWEDFFSKDIYFYGKDGRPYQEAFRGLRTNPQYEHWFKPHSSKNTNVTF